MWHRISVNSCSKTRLSFCPTNITSTTIYFCCQENKITKCYIHTCLVSFGFIDWEYQFLDVFVFMP
jgi:hypothetical protein